VIASFSSSLESPITTLIILVLSIKRNTCLSPGNLLYGSRRNLQVVKISGFSSKPIFVFTYRKKEESQVLFSP